MSPWLPGHYCQARNRFAESGLYWKKVYISERWNGCIHLSAGLYLMGNAETNVAIRRVIKVSELGDIITRAEVRRLDIPKEKANNSHCQVSTSILVSRLYMPA